MSDWALALEIVQILAICIVLFLLKQYGTPYIRKKGENLATKQDIAEITDKIEKVRSIYAERLEDISQQNRLLVEQAKRKHQLSIAALDRRLEAHQQAYALWWKLASVVYHETIRDVVYECEDWWIRNCIYLDAGSRVAFREAFCAAIVHRGFVQDYRGDPDQSEVIKDNWRTIMDAGEMIVKGVDLPSLGEKEYKPIDSSDPNGK